MENNYKDEIQAQQTKVTTKEIENFLTTHTNSIDNSVREMVSRDYSFMEKYVTKRGMAKLSNEIQKNRVRDVANFYELMYKIESDGKLKTAAEFVQLKTQSVSIQFQEDFRKFSENKRFILGEDSRKARKQISEQFKADLADIEEYKDIPHLYDKNYQSAMKQLDIFFELTDNSLVRFKETIDAKVKEYTLNS